MKRELFLITFIIFFTGCALNEPTKISEQPVQIVVASRKSGIESFETVTKMFMAKNPEIRVKLLDFSINEDGGHRFLSSILSGNEVQVDAFELEDVWVYEFAERNYAQALSEIVSLETGRYITAAINGMSRGGQLYAVPTEIDVGVLFGKKSLPDAECEWRAWLDGVQGSCNYSIQGLDGEDMMCTLMEIIRYYGGDAEAGLTAYRRMVAGSKNTLYDDNYLTLFKTGIVNITRAWISNEPEISDDLSKVKGLFNVSRLPDCDGKSAAYAKRYGYAMNPNTKHKAEVTSFLRFLTRDDTQQTFIKQKRVWPTLKTLYADPIIKDYVKYIEQDVERVEELNYRMQLGNYSELATKANAALKSFLNGEISVGETAACIKKLMN